MALAEAGGRLEVEATLLDLFDTAVYLDPVIDTALAELGLERGDYNAMIAPHAYDADAGRISYADFLIPHNNFLRRGPEHEHYTIVNALEPIPETTAFAQRRLDEGHLVGIATNVGAGVLDLCREREDDPLPPFMPQLAFESNRIRIPKPDTRFFAYAGRVIMGRFGVPKERVLVIDNSATNIGGVQQAGMLGEVFDPKDPEGSIARIEAKYVFVPHDLAA